MRRKNDKVFLEFQIGNRRVGRVVVELFNDITPRGAENFRELCVGVRGLGRDTSQPLSYAGCKVFEILPGQYMRCGDFEFNNGRGGESIYGGPFEDENFNLWHGCAGIVSMYNTGPNENRSQFYITFKQMPLFNRRHVIVGQVRRGMEVVRAIEKLPTTERGFPRLPVLICGCGTANDHLRADDATADIAVPNEPKETAAEKGTKLLNNLIADHRTATEPYNSAIVEATLSAAAGIRKSAAVRAQEEFDAEQGTQSARFIEDQEERARARERYHGLEFTIWNEESVFRKYDKHVNKYTKTGVNNMMVTNKKKDRRHASRANNQSEDVTYINYRNKLFNKKLEKAYGAYVVDIKQNLERGTAI